MIKNILTKLRNISQRRNNELEKAIVDIIGNYVGLIYKNGRYWGLCPFHKEECPSFTVFASKQEVLFYCFGCHKGGTLLDFIMEAEGLSKENAKNFLKERKIMLDGYLSG